MCGSRFGESLPDKDLLWWKGDFGSLVMAAWKSCGRTEVVAVGWVWVSDVAVLTLRLLKGTFQREEPFCSAE